LEKTLDAIFKIVIFGDAGSGKTTLTKRFKSDMFISDSQMTIGVDFETKNIEVDGKNVKLMIWDFGGEERFRFILPKYINGAMGGVCMYDITNYPSLAHIDNWLSVINGKKEQIPLVLLGGKADLDVIRQIPAEEGEKIAKQKGFSGFSECSSKTGENVEESFEILTRKMLENS
jgi:small GTP-binding protein